MGGLGSGVPSGGCAKGSTEAAHRIDVADLHRDGWLVPGRFGTLSWRCGTHRMGSIGYSVEDEHLMLDYHRAGERLSYPVRLSRTPCHFGGTRAWLHCPREACGRRVRVLYGGGRLFVCRACAGLTCPSTREDASDLHARRGDALRRRLGWPEGMLNPMGGRPKGMQRRTYWRLLHAYLRHQRAFLLDIDARFGLGVYGG